jgi:predicted PurR-regulated permease PerM
MDNVIKPHLISRQGAGIPTILIFIGVLGGLIAWGFLGIFLGATLLAIGYTVLRSWLDQSPSAVSGENLSSDQDSCRARDQQQ